MKMRSTKGALLMSALSLFLCFTMLMGTTFAWFTDSAASAGNIIKSGNLDVEMYWADGTAAVPAEDSTDWKNASKGPIFNYDNWEPGYVEVRHIKIANEGTLALKYKVSIVAEASNGVKTLLLTNMSSVDYILRFGNGNPVVLSPFSSRTAKTNKEGTLRFAVENCWHVSDNPLVIEVRP